MKSGILIFAVALGFVGCQKSRGDYRDDIAGAVCDKMRTCGKVGPEGKFKDFDDCRTAIAARYNKLWPAKKCDARIDAQKFNACRTRAVTNACDGNILDDVSFSIECGANDVCIAEPPAAKP